MTKPSLHFIYLLKQREHLGSRINDAVLGVLNRGQNIMGPEVKQLEEK